MSDSITSVLLDSSVLIKWFINEKDSDRALKLRKAFLGGKVNLVMPELALYEIANALRFSKLFSAEDIKKYIEALLTLDIEVLGFDFNCLNDAIDLSLEKELAIYDAYFVASARQNDLTFITADEKALKRIDDFEFAHSLAESIDELEL